MRTMKSVLIALLCLFASACSQQGMIDRLAPSADVKFAQSTLDDLRLGHLDSTRDHLAAKLRTADIDAQLTKIAGYFPAGVPRSVKTVGFRKMIEKAVATYPNFKAVATTLRHAKTASVNDWGAVCYYEGKFHEARPMPDLEIFDRVGGGDSFASGLIYGFLNDKGADWAVNCGCAHGALAMTTPGDTTMATFDEVQRVMKGGGARVQR